MQDDNGSSLLIGITAPFFRDADGRLFIESQAAEGLHAWADHFRPLTAFAITRPGPPPPGWIDSAAAGLTAPAFHLLSLPDTYDHGLRRRHRPAIESDLLTAMRGSRFRSFGYGGAIGDPGEIAAALARRHGLSHAIWLDRVESQVALQEAGPGLVPQVKAWVKSRLIARNEIRALRAANVGLLHGATVYGHFHRIAARPVQVEDVHHTEQDLLDPQGVAAKAAACARGPLRVVYCGRAVPMKGGLDWIAALAAAAAAGAAVEATWLGDGPDLPRMKAAARAAGLDGSVHFPGFVEDRDGVRAATRAAHVMLFCHQTDESPRTLIESLHGATPLVGYADPFASGLVAEAGAGQLVPRGDVPSLAAALVDLARDRTALANLIERAGRSARHLTRDAVFRERSELIRAHADTPLPGQRL